MLLCRFAVCSITLGGLILGASPAFAENNVPSDAVSYEVGQGWVSHEVNETHQDRWFVFRENALRSYCIEAVMGAATYFPLEPGLTLYQDGTGSVIYLTSNKSIITDPPMNKGARICYPSPLAVGQSVLRAVKVNVPVTSGSGKNGFVRLRAVDTTYFGPPVYMSTGTYTSYSTNMYVTNNTFANVRVILASRDFGKINETLIGPGNYRAAYTIPYPAGTSKYYFGMAYVLHDGPPGALDGSAIDSFYGGQSLNGAAVPLTSAR